MSSHQQKPLKCWFGFHHWDHVIEGPKSCKILRVCTRHGCDKKKIFRVDHKWKNGICERCGNKKRSVGEPREREVSPSDSRPLAGPGSYTGF